MKHTINRCIIIYLLTTTISCIAMDKSSIIKKNPNILELTCTQKTRQAFYLTSKRVLISDSKGCSLIDPITNTLIKQISSTKKAHIALHPNQTKFALTYKTKITLYNAKTLKREWTSRTYPQEQIASSTFNPHDNTLFVYYKTVSSITRHAYLNNECYLFGHRYYQPDTTMIAFNPTQQQVAIASSINNWCQLYERGYLPEPIYTGEDCNFCEYSPDGYTLVKGNQSSIHTLDLSNEKKNLPWKPLLEQSCLPILCIKFHPNSSFLTTLSGPDGVISYWSIPTNRLIRTMPPLYPQNPTIPSTKNCCLSFEPDYGDTLLATFSGKCFKTPVPFGIIAQPHAIFTYWVLKNYQRNNQDHTIPDDIIYFLIHTLLRT